MSWRFKLLCDAIVECDDKRFFMHSCAEERSFEMWICSYKQFIVSSKTVWILKCFQMQLQNSSVFILNSWMMRLVISDIYIRFRLYNFFCWMMKEKHNCEVFQYEHMNRNMSSTHHSWDHMAWLVLLLYTKEHVYILLNTTCNMQSSYHSWLVRGHLLWIKQTDRNLNASRRPLVAKKRTTEVSFHS